MGTSMEKNSRNLTTKKMLLAEFAVILFLLVWMYLDDKFDYSFWVVMWILCVLVINIGRAGYLASNPPRPHWKWFVFLLCMPLMPLAAGVIALLAWNGKMC